MPCRTRPRCNMLFPSHNRLTTPTDDSEIPLEIDYSGVEPEALEKARVLFETVGEVLGRAARGALSIGAGFYELGGNSLNSIYTITRLRDKGYFIGKQKTTF